jgi:hypothetical protein
VDCANHQEIGLLMTDDLLNSPQISKIGKYQFDEFEKVIAEVDSGKIKSVPQPGVRNAKDYLKLVRLRVYRAAYINSFQGRIKLHKFSGDASPKAMVSNLYGLIDEMERAARKSGYKPLDWKDYKKFLRKKFRNVKPTEYIPTREENDDPVQCSKRVTDIYLRHNGQK